MTTARIDFRAVKEHASFAEILHRYSVTLSGSGAQRMVRCPFHDDHEPSCSVHLEEKVFHCFSCLAQGDILDFVAKIENVSLRDAAAIIAEWCGVPVLGETRTPKPRLPPRKQDVDNAPLGFTLRLNPEHPYLKQRGVSPETVRTFGLGFCDRGIMRGRICIPIHDAVGSLVAYTGRWAEAELPDGEPRYKFPAGFKKNLILYNFNRVTDAEHIVIVEGYWSVFRLHALGLSSVALMGSSLSDAQEALLKKSRARYVTLLLDGDQAGHSAIAELLPRLAENFFVRAPILPEGAEPDTVSDEILTSALDW